MLNCFIVALLFLFTLCYSNHYQVFYCQIYFTELKGVKNEKICNDLYVNDDTNIIRV